MQRRYNSEAKRKILYVATDNSSVILSRREAIGLALKLNGGKTSKDCSRAITKLLDLLEKENKNLLQ